MPLRLNPARDRKLHALFQDGEPRSLRRGRYVYRAGEPASLVYLVQKGHVRLTLPKRGNGGEHTVEVAGPSEVFGTEAFLRPASRLYGARAGEACTLLALDGEGVWKVVRRGRKSHAAFVRALREDVFRARAAATTQSSARTAERLADVVLELGRRFGEQRGAEIVIPHGFSHQELADLAGAHRSTVTTTLNDWIYEGILKEAYRGLVIARTKDLAAQGSGTSLCPPPAVDSKTLQH